MNSPRNYFTPEGYRRLAKNPFVDQKMLQFIKDKTRQAGVPVTSESAGASLKGAGKKPVMSEKAAQLIAAAIKGLLKE
jgi:hypothetical protein